MRYGKHEINDDLVRLSAVPRIRARIKRDNTTGCDVWQAGLDGDGYALLSIGPVRVKVHRFLLIKQKGPLAPGIEAEHKCRNRACVRIHPDHVRPLSGVENIRIGIAHRPDIVAKRVAIRKERGNYSLAPEVREQISKKLKGRKLSDETRAKMSASRTGRKLPEETKQKISEAHYRNHARKT
jgi:hypothetical protein